MGVPGWPLLAASTASIASVRIVLMATASVGVIGGAEASVGDDIAISRRYTSAAGKKHALWASAGGNECAESAEFRGCRTERQRANRAAIQPFRVVRLWVSKGRADLQLGLPERSTSASPARL